MLNTTNTRLNELLAKIESQLLAWIPNAVSELSCSSPAYCLFLWYHDLSPIEFTPQFGIATLELREACLSGQFNDKMGGDTELAIWAPQQSITQPFPGFPLLGRDCDIINEETKECYDILSQTESGLPPADEALALLPFRAVMHHVARELNALDWHSRLPITDDFVVVASDYVGYWLDDDFEKSIPAEKLEKLRSTKLISW